MDINRLTEKAQQALQEAQNDAVRRGHVEIDGEHLLLALAKQSEGLIPRLLQKLDVRLDAFVGDLDGQLARRPKVSGPGVEPGKALVTQRLNKILVDADSEEILGAAVLGVGGDEVVHALIDAMYAKTPYTTISRAVHIHPTVAELLPTTLQGLEPLA